MKRISVLLLLLYCATAWGYTVSFPVAPPAGQPGSTAIHKSSGAFISWADGYSNLVYGAAVSPAWKTPAKALGPALGGADDVVCLGQGGQITMTFSKGISDGAGYDFAVFENALNDTFLELAWVEVSSDGIHFTRFPNFSDTPFPVDSYGVVLATQVYGLASKYSNGYGTPFDLAELAAVSDSIASGGHSLTPAYVASFNASYPHLDPSDIRFVRLIDIVGDGSAVDAEGFIIYDPYPTGGSAGFDLDAVGVMNEPAASGLPQNITFQPIPHQKLAFQSLELSAVSDSGLEVSFTIQSGPAAITNDMLLFSGTGTVEVIASQAGDAAYAAAAPVLRSFRIAEEIQHIFFEQVPNRLKDSADVQLRAYSSSGLPVEIQVDSAPPNVLVNAGQLMTLGDMAGSVILRAMQPGSGLVAPAEDVLVRFEIVEPGTSNAPVSFETWLTAGSVPDPTVTPLMDAYGRSAIQLDYTLDQTAPVRCRVMESTDLVNWTNAVPEITGQSSSNGWIQVTVCLPADQTNGFQRLEFEEL